MPARVRQADALAVALEQRTADLGLQFVDQVRHGGLRVAQPGRRLAEAAAFDRREQCPQFSVVHMLPPFSCFSIFCSHHITISGKATDKIF